MDIDKILQYAIEAGVILMQVVIMNRQSRIGRKIDSQHQDRKRSETILCQYRQDSADLVIYMADDAIIKGANGRMKEKRDKFKKTVDKLNEDIAGAVAEVKVSI